MADNKTDKKQQAQFIYMTEGKSQKEIADRVGVSERTIHTWVHRYAWDKLRLASFQAPATIADNLCSQLVELQNTIAAREPGNRFPTPQEAEVTRKLITCLEKMKKYPSLSQNMQVLETFRNYIRPLDKEFSGKLGDYTEKFLTGRSINGFAPYQVEYGVDAIAPVSPFYEETEEGCDTKDTRCPDINTCLHVGQCHYPKCMEDRRPPQEALSRYGISPVVLQRDRALAFSQSLRQAGSIPANKPVENAPGLHVPAAGDSLPAAGPKPETTGSNPANMPAANVADASAAAIDKQLPLSPQKTGTTGSNPANSQWNSNEKPHFSGSRKHRKQLREQKAVKSQLP